MPQAHVPQARIMTASADEKALVRRARCGGMLVLKPAHHVPKHLRTRVTKLVSKDVPGRRTLEANMKRSPTGRPWRLPET
jgi:hypothetical protein